MVTTKLMVTTFGLLKCNIILNLEEVKAWIDEYSDWISEIEPAPLKKNFEEILTRAGFGIISFTEHYFEPQGYTGLWLISESHFAVHTFPEENKTYIQLSSCNREMYYRFIELLKEYKENN